MSQWQPIETYPRKVRSHGPYVLLWSEDKGISIGNGVDYTSPDAPKVIFYDSYGWILYPTHWQVLPETPL